MMYFPRLKRTLLQTVSTVCVAGLALGSAATLSAEEGQDPFYQPDPTVMPAQEDAAAEQTDQWGDFFDALEQDGFGGVDGQQPQPPQPQPPQPRPNPNPNPNPTPNPSPTPPPQQPAQGPQFQVPSHFVRKDGLFPMYVDPRSGNVGMVIHQDQITTDADDPKEFVYTYQVRNGVPQMFNFTGRYGPNNRIITFVMKYNMIEVYSHQRRYTYDDDSPLARSAGQNMSDSLVAILRVGARSTDGRAFLVDPRPLFLSQNLDPIFGVPVVGPFGGQQPFARIGEVRNFEKNTNVRVQIVTTAGLKREKNQVSLQQGEEMNDNRSVITEIQHSIVAMPDEDGFTPRMDDQRVGYFLDRVTNLTSTSETPYQDMIKRWRLVKADPEAEISEPVEPITFWIENTTPPEFRETIREAALEWNKAFEVAGFKNAIVVKDQPDNTDWDAGDIRYNVIRWVASPTPPFLGYGPSFSNPRTGEILGADIMLEYTAMRVYYWVDKLLAHAEEEETQVDTETQAASRLAPRHGNMSNAVTLFSNLSEKLRGDGIDPASVFGPFAEHALFDDGDDRILDLAEFLRAEDRLAEGDGPSEEWAKRITALVKAGSPDFMDEDNQIQLHTCHAAERMHHQAMFGVMAMIAQGADAGEVRGMIREALSMLVMHEVGHTLGLMHNFKSSQLHSVEEIHNRSITEEQGLLGSVMDYDNINIAGPNRPQGQYFSTTVGPYDKWAIEFGYTPVKDDPEAEKAWRKEVLGRSLDPALAFGNDADRLLAVDPRAAWRDMSSDAVVYALERAAVVDLMLTNLKDRYTIEGETWQPLLVAYSRLLREDRIMADVLSGYIGGVKIERFVAGQQRGDRPFDPISLEQQKNAMQGLARYLFAPDALSAPAELYPFLQVQRRGFANFQAQTDPKIHRAVFTTQARAIMRIMNPRTSERVLDSSLYGNDYPMIEVLGDLKDALFQEDLGGSVNTHRQVLQAFFVRWLRSMVAGNLSKNYDDVAIAAALKTLKDINAMMAPGFFGINEATLDAPTVAHRANLRRLIRPVIQ